MIHKLITTLLFLSFSYSAFATEKPYPFWLAEKDGKKVYMLGTVHATSLKEYQCNSKIKNHIKSSDLVFLEKAGPTNLLSIEDRRALYIGSESEKQDVLSKLPDKDRISISKSNRFEAIVVQAIRMNVLMKSGESATFEDLNSQAQEFLINHGFKPSTYNEEIFLKETFYFIYLTAFRDALLDFDHMGIEIALFSKSNKIPMKSLDKDQISFVSEKDSQDSRSEKEAHPVMINTIEQFIATYEEQKKAFSSIFKAEKDTVLSSLSQGHLKEQEQTIDKAQEQKLEGMVKDKLLKNRNIIWVEKITQALNTEENNTIFVAGGVLHFLGSDNVIDRLKEEGFNIKKLHCSEESLIQD